jgi:hypothetical protein
MIALGRTALITMIRNGKSSLTILIIARHGITTNERGK